MGWLSDKIGGIVAPLAVGVIHGRIRLRRCEPGKPTSWQFALVHGLMIGIGGSASFGPVIADISTMVSRGGAVIAVAIGRQAASLPRRPRFGR